MLANVLHQLGAQAASCWRTRPPLAAAARVLEVHVAVACGMMGRLRAQHSSQGGRWIGVADPLWLVQAAVGVQCIPGTGDLPVFLGTSAARGG